MKEYPIIQDHFTESDCYKTKKTCAKTGIQVHSVGCKGTYMSRWKKSWNRPGRDVCANYVIDMNGIYEVLPKGNRCWLSGRGDKGNAGDTHLGFEICEPVTKKDTPEVAADLYGKVLFLCVYLCKEYGINPEKVQAHYELRRLGLASNHADVSHWWGKRGTSWEPYTMARLRNDIAAELGQGGVTPVVISQYVNKFIKVNTSKDEGQSLWQDVKKSARVKLIKKGEIMFVEEDVGNGWVKAVYKENGQHFEGYADSQYFIVPARQECFEGSLAQINTSGSAGLSLWDSPSKKASMIKAKKGEIISVIDDTLDQFVYAEYKGVKGYVDSQYLVPYEIPDEEEEVVVEPDKYTVTISGLSAEQADDLLLQYPTAKKAKE